MNRDHDLFIDEEYLDLNQWIRLFIYRDGLSEAHATEKAYRLLEDNQDD